MVTQIEKDIKATIRLLRFLTHGEGYASISVFDAGAGGGFGEGTLNIILERSGLLLTDKHAYEPQELFELIKKSVYPYEEIPLAELNEKYKNRKWNK